MSGSIGSTHVYSSPQVNYWRLEPLNRSRQQPSGNCQTIGFRSDHIHKFMKPIEHVEISCVSKPHWLDRVPPRGATVFLNKIR